MSMENDDEIDVLPEQVRGSLPIYLRELNFEIFIFVFVFVFVF